jgi:hypothetical protein
MKCAEPTKFHRKSGMWGTRGFVRTIVKALVGFAHRFRPMYAFANMGHPSSSL